MAHSRSPIRSTGLRRHRASTPAAPTSPCSTDPSGSSRIRSTAGTIDPSTNLPSGLTQGGNPVLFSWGPDLRFGVYQKLATRNLANDGRLLPAYGDQN